MPGWPKNPKQLGKEHPRYGASSLVVTGAAKYTSDMQPVGWLYAMILRSPWPAARIRAVDLRPALGISGIRAAVVANDPPFTVRYYGEEVAAVAGLSKQACLDALGANSVGRGRTRPKSESRGRTSFKKTLRRRSGPRCEISYNLFRNPICGFFAYPREKVQCRISVDSQMALAS